MKEASILCDYHECTGCTACKSVCPTNAIEMRENEQGFLYPYVDEKKCINCGICGLAVERLNTHMFQPQHMSKPLQYYAVKLRKDEERMRSQSGGAFFALAQEIIRTGGIVYGCVITENFHVRHMRASTLNELQKMRGSKYVQSDLGDCMHQIEIDLINAKKVLFTGTPCQVAGVEAYIEQRKLPEDKFFSCDLICHGVPSPGVFKKYLQFMEKTYHCKIKYINFRDKSVASWHESVERLIFENGTEYQGKIYSELFYSNLALRTCCESCKYTRMNRPSDITIGDCWGIEEMRPELWNDEKGISIIIVQTEKGKELLESAMKYLDLVELSSYTQPQLRYPADVPHQKGKFWHNYQKLDFDKLLQKYTSYGGLRLKIKRKLLRAIGRW